MSAKISSNVYEVAWKDFDYNRNISQKDFFKRKVFVDDWSVMIIDLKHIKS